MSSLLFGGPPALAGAAEPAAAGTPRTPPPELLPPRAGAQRNSTLIAIAGVGVLLLAMGVGVLIGRSGASKQTPGPAQVITVAAAGTSGAPSSASGEAAFTSSWPAGKSGYTVQLQTLSQSGTGVSAVEAAKSAASAKGANAVGALESSEFTSLTPGEYVIYSGVYGKRAEAEKALAGLRGSFPAAKVVQVGNASPAGAAGAGAGASGSSPSGAPSGGASGSESHPAPATVLKSEKGKKGKSYEEQSKNLPNVVETG